jgi:glycosyltransferase 2 family protein
VDRRARDRRVDRNHLWILLGAAVAFFAVFVVVAGDKVSRLEADLTIWINDAPDWLAWALWPVMQLGTVWGPIIVGAIAAYIWGPRRGAAVLVSGIGAWFLAKWVKDIVQRGRPLAFIPSIDVREGKGTGLGFVSGHTAVAFAIATALYPVLSRKGRVVAYAIATVVGLARIVFGMHFPLDVVGGACLGIVCGCVVDLVLLAVPGGRPAREGRGDPART